MDRKLVVLGIPWDVDTDGLREYMSAFGKLDDVVVIRDRSTGRSRGFGYVTFSSTEDAKNALASEHVLGDRTLEVKIATPKEEMKMQPSRRITRIFVAKIPHSVSEAMFRSHFEAFGEIIDLYMPKDNRSKNHRGIGFITFDSADSVDALMAETHELGGSTLVVDRATPKDEELRIPHSMSHGGYGAYNAYINSATRYATLGVPPVYENAASTHGRTSIPSRGMGRKIFIGKLPQEATTDDLHQYFGKFGRITDVYIPKDPKRAGHRGFGFVTYMEDGVVDRVSRRSHEILGQRIAIDSAAPLDDSGSRGLYTDDEQSFGGGYGGPVRPYYGRMYGSLDFHDWGYGGSGRPSKMDWRYKPY